MYPHLGKSGSPYARTVTTKTHMPAVLPDASVIFDGKDPIRRRKERKELMSP